MWKWHMEMTHVWHITVLYPNWLLSGNVLGALFEMVDLSIDSRRRSSYRCGENAPQRGEATLGDISQSGGAEVSLWPWLQIASGKRLHNYMERFTIFNG